MKTAVNPKLAFTGEVVTFSRKGNSVKAKGRFGSGMFESELPLLVKGSTCPHLRGSWGDGSHLISQGCTGPDAVMKRAAWKFTGLVAGIPSPAYPYSLSVGTFAGSGASALAALAANAVFLNWFANGYVEWGAGANLQRRSIIGSTAPVAGAIVLTLHRYFSAVPAFGDALTIYPGCDGQYATCKAYDVGTNPTGKFGNDKNFGGEPFLPIANPTVSGQPGLGTQGAKK